MEKYRKMNQASQSKILFHLKYNQGREEVTPAPWWFKSFPVWAQEFFTTSTLILNWESNEDIDEGMVSLINAFKSHHAPQFNFIEAIVIETRDQLVDFHATWVFRYPSYLVHPLIYYRY